MIISVYNSLFFDGRCLQNGKSELTLSIYILFACYPSQVARGESESLGKIKYLF